MTQQNNYGQPQFLIVLNTLWKKETDIETL